MDNNQSTVVKHIKKLSELAFSEMAMIVFCLLLQFFSWASYSYLGKELYTFIPFGILGYDFIWVAVIFLLAAALRYFGRFSGMTLVVFFYMLKMVLSASSMLDVYIEATRQIGSWANGLADALAPFADSHAASSGAVSQSIGRFYEVVGFFVALLGVCVLCSWAVSIYRLACKHREELTREYKNSMLCYLVIGIVALLYICFDYEDLPNIVRNPFNNFPLALSALVAGIMLTMLLFNAIVSGVIYLLREHNNRKMAMRALMLSGVCLVVGLISWYVIEVLSYGVDWERVDTGLMLKISAWYFLRALAFIAMITCLLRAIYHRFVVPQGAPSKSAWTKTFDVRKWKTTSMVAIAVVALVAVVLILFKCCGSVKAGNDLLPVQKPAWEKFMVLTDDEVLLYKEADLASPTLEIMREDLESDAISFYYKWSNVGTQRGFVSNTCLLSRDVVLPILEESGEWYKVLVSDDEIGAQECYVQKRHGKEVKAEPITLEQVNAICSYNWSSAYLGLITKGDYENICFIAVSTEMYGDRLDVGVLYDGVLVNPLTRRIATRYREGWDGAFTVENDGVPVLVYGDALQREWQLDARVIEKEEEQHRLTISSLFEAVPERASEYQLVSYYIPDVATDRFFTFVIKTSGENNDAIAEGSDDVAQNVGTLKDFTYIVEGKTDPSLDPDDTYATMYSLYVRTGSGEKIPTELENFAISLNIIDQGDYDGDGYMEAVVYAWGGGAAINPPYVAYYDPSEGRFNQAYGFDDLGENPELKVEQWKGQTSFVSKVGLRRDRYVYEGHSVTLVEQIAPNVGKRNVTITKEKLFGASEESESRTIGIDIDGDGVDEQVTFYHESSAWQSVDRSMKLKSIVWSDGRQINENSEILGTSFSFLDSTTNGVPDILLDDAWFYKWDGETFTLQ